MTTFFFILAISAGFAILIWGADRFIDGAANIARNLGVSPLIVGLTIVGFGTSAPEMLVSALAAFDGAPALGVGNAIGSNIANIGLVLGVTALFCPLPVLPSLLKRELPILLAATFFGGFLIMDNHLGRSDGLIIHVLNTARGVVNALEYSFMRGDETQQPINGQRWCDGAKLGRDRISQATEIVAKGAGLVPIDKALRPFQPGKPPVDEFGNGFGARFPS